MPSQRARLRRQHSFLDDRARRAAPFGDGVGHLLHRDRQAVERLLDVCQRDPVGRYRAWIGGVALKLRGSLLQLMCAGRHRAVRIEGSGVWRHGDIMGRRAFVRDGRAASSRAGRDSMGRSPAVACLGARDPVRREDRSGWQERRLLDRILERFEIPMTVFQPPSD